MADGVVRAWAALSQEDFTLFRHFAIKVYGQPEDAALVLAIAEVARQYADGHLPIIKTQRITEDKLRFVYGWIPVQLFERILERARISDSTIGEAMTSAARQWVHKKARNQ